MCTSIDRPVIGPEPALWTMKIEAARATVARMNDIVLPLLLGWLGAHAWVLRRMTVDIAAKALAKGSMLSTLVRLSLGAHNKTTSVRTSRSRGTAPRRASCAGTPRRWCRRCRA
jgi:hypothetical protein